MAVFIKSVGVGIPEQRISNEELAARVDTTDEWIRTHTGIGFRHFAADGVLTSDLAAIASREALADLMTLEDEGPKAREELILHHTSADYRHLRLKPAELRPLLSKVMEGGKIAAPLPSLSEIRSGLRGRFDRFDPTFLRLLNPHVYKVSISAALRALKLSFIGKYMKEDK